MKRWTQHEPRTGATLDVDQFNAEQVAHRGSIASLDRTQLPQLSSAGVFVQDALHDMWVFRVGEQTDVVGTGVNAQQWRAMTTRNYSGQAVNCGTVDLLGHKGGMTFVQWTGAGFVNAMALQETTGTGSMEKRLQLRILVNGVVAAHSEGLLQGLESFRVFGNILLPPGDLKLQLQATGIPVGDDGPLSNEPGTTTIMSYHVINSQVFVLARYR